MTLSDKQVQAENFVEGHTFVGTDGSSIRDYDDVRLTRPLDITMGDLAETPVSVPAGTIATVLMHSDGPIGVAHLECYPAEGGFGFGFEECATLVLDKTREQKFGNPRPRPTIKSLLATFLDGFRS